MKFLTIGQLSKEAGIAPSAIRYYESVGVLPKPRRRNGRRVYDEATFDLLRAIEVAKSAGFSIAEIRVLSRGLTRGSPLSRMWKQLAKSKLAELDKIIDRATAMKTVLQYGLDCDCLTPGDCKLLGDA